MYKVLLFSYLIVNLAITSAQNMGIDYPLLKTTNYQTIYLSRNDSIFIIYFFPKIENYDSTLLVLHAVKFSKNKWINVPHTDSTYTIIKYRKKVKSPWFKKNNGKIFHADYECKVMRYWSYEPNGYIRVYRRIGKMANLKYVKKKN
jgi:hypothetical protein